MESEYKTLKKSYKNRELPLFRLPNSYYNHRKTLTKAFSLRVPILNRSLGFILTTIIIIISAIRIIYQKKNINYYASIFLGLSYLLSTKNSFLILLTGILYETQIKIHKTMAFFAFFLGSFHGLYNLFFREINFEQKISGIVLLSMLFLLVFTGAFFSVFSSFFNDFIFLHKIFFFSALVAAFFHKAYNVFFFGVFWSWLDLFFRFVVVMRNNRYLTHMEMEVIEDKFVKIIFYKDRRFTFQEGQFCWLYIPSISLVHFHPFSICSSNSENEIKFIIKKFDNFTKKLLEKIKRKEKFKIYVDGPYGGSLIDLWDKNYEEIFLIAGGIGITSILSFTKFFLNKLHLGKIKKIELYWINRDICLYNEIKELQKIYKNDTRFKINVFLTRNKKNGFVNNRPVWKKEFKIIKNFCEEKDIRKIGVFVCGPTSLKDEVVSNCVSFSDEKIIFDYHFEEFNPLFI